MTLTANGTFNVADQTPLSASASVVVQPPVTVGTGHGGRLVHPTLGTYDYSTSPDELVNIDGGPLYGPIWSHSATLGGGVDTVWEGSLRDTRVLERWGTIGDVGGPIALARMLWQFYANPPTPPSYVIWAPTYATASTWNVAIVGVRVGAESYTLNQVLLARGYVPAPIELEMRVISAI